MPRLEFRHFWFGEDMMLPQILFELAIVLGRKQE
jgi:hypothetical protein